MILIGIGGNLESERFGPPRETLTAALAELEADGIRTIERSGWYRSEPVPRSGQPWFINAVASLETALEPNELLGKLQSAEARFGRVRGEPNAARVLDLDLLDYHSKVLRTRFLVLPHPRLHQRRFVLEPLAELAPAWLHPLFGLTAGQLLARLADEQQANKQQIERLPC
jgi:2-amino-4-hydroxy-6-hydroxymethyldihydropteridine diphosphokinase